ncbi:MAG TPA: histidine phosphatase family protein [Stellaceae bacterium]|nr:histidine phosphatase family protein [Stellaceae bacterium]
MAKLARWWWVRHAPVTVNNGRCYGQTDVTCDCSNQAAFAKLAARLPREAVWVTSPLQRTHLTARAIVAAGLPGPDPIPGPAVTVEPDLIEQHFGEWQGVSYAELASRTGNHWPRFWLAPAHEAPPGGESFASLMERVHPAILRLSERFAGNDIISVSHGGTIRAALALALDIEAEVALSFTIDNLSITSIDYFADPNASRPWRVGVVNQPPLL